jgi:archaellum component FlaC
MNKINSVALSVTGDSGNISYIVELLEDPEDAKDNLKPELEEVKKTTTECRKECEEISKKFEYWQLLILHLSQTALDLHGEFQKQSIILRPPSFCVSLHFSGPFAS